jgi:hypothetical protein
VSLIRLRKALTHVLFANYSARLSLFPRFMNRALLFILALPLFAVNAQVIRGRVVDADAKPVAGAQVQVILAERSSLDFITAQRAATAEDGRYEVPAPPFIETESAVIVVTLPAHAAVRSAPFHVGKGDLVMDVTLPRFELVTVHVTNRGNKPLPKARVAFATSDDMAALSSPATLLLEQFAGLHVPVNDEGEATLHLVPGTWDFVAIADDFQPAIISERVIKRPASIAMRLDPAVTISGRVHRKDVGVANAEVLLLQGVGRSRDDRSTVTDAEGAFEIRGLAPGPYRVSITREEELLQRVIETKAPAKLDVALPPAGTLRTRVVDANTREPVLDFFYSVEPLGQPDVHTYQTRLSTNDGAIMTTLAAGTYRIMAAAVGYTMTRPVDVRVTESEPAELTMALERGIIVTGRVSDENDAPVSDAEVFVGSPAMQERSIGPSNTRTNADGSFTVSGIDPGSVSLVVGKEGFLPFWKSLTLDSGASVDVQLSRGLSLEGVVRRGGKPVADVQVDATTPGMGGGKQSARSDATGRFVLRGLVAARYTIVAYTAESSTRIDNVDPTRPREVVLSLDPEPTGVIFGVVTGLPPSLGGKTTRRVYAQSLNASVEGMIDDAGSYRIEDVPVGDVLLSAQLESATASRSSLSKRVELAAGQELRVDLDLPSAYSVHGRVTDDAKSAPGVRVVFANDTGHAGSATSRADGTYEVVLPSAGKYQIFVEAESLPNGNTQLIREIRGGETVDIELRQPIIEGTVVDALTHQPLEGVRVTLGPENAPVQWNAGEVTSDAAGRFRMPAAGSGSYRIVAWARGYGQRAQPIQLGPARLPQIAFELTKTDGLRVRVVDARSSIPLDAYVTIASTDNSYLGVRCDRDITDLTYTCSLAPGKYLLTVVVQGYADRQLQVTAPGEVGVLME